MYTETPVNFLRVNWIKKWIQISNLIYNIFPILLIRDTRRRVKRILQRVNGVGDTAIDRHVNAAAANDPAT